jgi:hypothetical protein
MKGPTFEQVADMAAFQTALSALDAHWNSQELSVDYGHRLLWLLKQVHTAWMVAGGDKGEIAGLALGGCSPRLTRALFMGGLLSLTTTAMAMMQTVLVRSDAESQSQPEGVQS